MYHSEFSQQIKMCGVAFKGGKPSIVRKSTKAPALISSTPNQELAFSVSKQRQKIPFMEYFAERQPSSEEFLMNFGGA